MRINYILCNIICIILIIFIFLYLTRIYKSNTCKCDKNNCVSNKEKFLIKNKDRESKKIKFNKDLEKWMKENPGKDIMNFIEYISK